MASKAVEYIFFPRAHETLPKIDYISDHKTSLNLEKLKQYRVLSLTVIELNEKTIRTYLKNHKFMDIPQHTSKQSMVKEKVT